MQIIKLDATDSTNQYLKDFMLNGEPSDFTVVVTKEQRKGRGQMLKTMLIPNLSIKWPNDIMSGSAKICGILIENILLGNEIQASVVGVGLNVNQQTFNNLVNVSSLKLLLGRSLNIDELLKLILSNFKEVFETWKEEGIDELWNSYENMLFRKDKASTFKNKEGELIMGFIRGVNSEGRLLIELEGTVLKEFNLKEVQLLY